jgi:trigger factor
VNVTVERLGPCQARIQFTVPTQEFRDACRQALQSMGQRANMKGFRPGKVPLSILEKQFGAQVRSDAIEHFVRQAYDQATVEHALKVVGFQRLNVDEIKIPEDGEWQGGFEVSLRPDIALGEYKGLAVESQLEPVMDGEIEAAIANLRVQQSRPEPAGEAGLPDDGLAVCKVTWLDGERAVLERDNLRLAPRTPTPGTDAEAFRAGLSGANEGETREIAMTFPPDFPEEALRGKPGRTRLEVKQAFRLVPPADAELHRLAGAADAPAFAAFVRARLEEQKQQQEDARVESEILERLLSGHTIELPAMMLDEQVRVRTEQLKRELGQQGLAAEAVAAQVESQKDAVRAAAERGLRALFLVQTIGEKEGLLVSREDMEAELGSIALRNQATIEEVREFYTKNRGFDQMAVELLERKVRRFLRENAKVEAPS